MEADPGVPVGFRAHFSNCAGLGAVGAGNPVPPQSSQMGLLLRKTRSVALALLPLPGAVRS